MKCTTKTGMILGLLITLTLAGCSSVELDTDLTRAAEAGDATKVKSLIAKGADPNGRESHSYTPLMIAARGGHTDVIKVLLEAKANTEMRDCRTGWTPLIHALHKSKNTAAQALIDGGANVNAPATDCGEKSAEGDITPLMFAAAYDNAAMVKALLDRGANPYSMHGADTPLSSAVRGMLPFGDIDGASSNLCPTETVKTLLEKAPDLNMHGGLADRTAIYIARQKGCMEVVSLLEQRRSVPAWDQGGSRLGTHLVRVSPVGWISGEYTSRSDGDYHSFLCGETKVEIKSEELFVNGKSYGALQPGDMVDVNDGTVTVNATEVREVAVR